MASATCKGGQSEGADRERQRGLEGDSEIEPSLLAARTARRGGCYRKEGDWTAALEVGSSSSPWGARSRRLVESDSGHVSKKPKIIQKSYNIGESDFCPKEDNQKQRSKERRMAHIISSFDTPVPRSEGWELMAMPIPLRKKATMLMSKDES
jgi:hypothetical protein